MANALYPLWKQAQVGASPINLDTADIRVVLVDLADYTYDAGHEFLSSVGAAARVSVSATLTSTTIALGVFDSDNTVFSAVTGDVSEGLILYCHDGGADAARRLIAYYDTGVTGFPVTPNGGDINLTVNGSGWFAL